MRRIAYVTLALFAVFISSPSIAEPAIYTSSSNVAIGGYDAVSYFGASGPVVGKSAHSTQWNGATWQFASAENLSTFQADPEKYAPQYGGYCAFAVGHNALAPGNPLNWHIENDKLYLNLNNGVQQRWLSNRRDLISKADRNFSGLIR